MLPLMVDVRNRLVIVIGGGKIAYRRLSVFLKQGAKIKVISPHVIEEISLLHAQSQIEWKQKEADIDDLQEAFIIVAATDSKEVNAWAAREAGEHQLVNLAGESELGNVQVPSFHQRGRLTLAVSTGGASPTLAKNLSKQFIDQFDDAFIDLIEELFKEREKIKAADLSQDEKKRLLIQLAKKSMDS
ncbi:precorrin-2 dehydrogenase/sirohydrochlorin ferrochelatase family protein [Metabacillus idriensis]|uniref:precorrin-2 dehydrogenase/sirohydrochlorin ferrochelatase family protein n=1 Tax=Metabacillus idriensis TaxID=324768 RepID=UPI00174A53F8|nr:NAD(P)-dependent oxidoreductase [Metabacillus idriensis]